MARKNKVVQTVGIGDVNVRWTRTYEYYMNLFTQLAISMFEWQGLPESVNPWFLENTIFRTGSCTFFKDDILGYLALPMNTISPPNIYNLPSAWQAYAVTGYTHELDESTGVIIWNNPTHNTLYNAVELYADRLAEIQSVIDANVKGQKFPPLILTNSERLLTAKNIMQQYQGNEPAIYADMDFDPKSLQCINLNIPYLVDKLQAAKHDIINECYTLLAISNANTDKKERLIVDEVNANDGQILATTNNMLMMRQLACDQINKMFGLNVSVKLRTASGGDDNGAFTNVYESATTEQVYNDTAERSAPDGDEE